MVTDPGRAGELQAPARIFVSTGPQVRRAHDTKMRQGGRFLQ